MAYDLNKLAEAIAGVVPEEEGFDVVHDNANTENVPEPPKEILPAPEVEAPPAEEKPAEEAPPAEAKADEPPSWRDDFDYLKTKLEFIQGSQERMQPRETAAPAPVSKSIRDISEPEEYYSYIEGLEKNAKAAFSAVKAMEAANAARELAALKEQYPDIEDYVKPHLERGIDIRLQKGLVGADWKEPLLQVYDVATQWKRFGSVESVAEENRRLKAELEQIKAGKQADELAAKRAQKSEVQTAGMVPPGGSSFQSPVVPQRSSGPQRGYGHAAKAVQQLLGTSGG